MPSTADMPPDDDDAESPLDWDALSKDPEELADALGAERINLSRFEFDLNLVREFPLELVRTYNVLPLRAENDTVTVALAYFSKIDIIDEIGYQLGKEIVVNIAERTQLSLYIARFFP
jgi:hypothetical protein